LPKLKVAVDWLAPVERNRFEVAWYSIAHSIVPEAVPAILYHDDSEMLCAMAYLDPAEHRLWKLQLRDGRAELADAAAVGSRLGRIHAATANNPDVAAQFPPNDSFHAIRLEPYLEATAATHPDLHEALFELSERTRRLRIAMVYGDVSPKKILLGPNGPVFLDAECACIGDPAFDVAFCLNHLLLKSLWNRPAQAAFRACFQALTDAYLEQVEWEPRESLETRAASLLPALLLARVDGKSPVEYIETDTQREHVRRRARPLIKIPPKQLVDVFP
jgi:5-methylthioribose kinase